jgi:bifunctional isochorismate lyase/aryl carrier protein
MIEDQPVDGASALRGVAAARPPDHVATGRGLPAIPRYRVPDGVDLPVSRIAWRPDRSRMAVLIHDMQRYFVRPFGDGHEALGAAISNMRRLRAACARLEVPVIFTVQPGSQSSEQRGLLAELWGSGLGAGVDERILDELRPGESDRVLRKHRYSAFVGSGLHEILRRAGRDQLVVCGIYAHIGCLVTCCDAFMRDVQAFLLADAVADFSLAHHLSALEWVAGQCARVVSTRTLLAELGEDCFESAGGGRR